MSAMVFVFLRLMYMTSSLVTLLFIYRHLFKVDETVSVFESANVFSMIVMSTLVYYCLGNFCYAALHPPTFARRTRQVNEMYLGMETGTTQIITGVPKLTMANVWLLVYGLGFVLFTTGYCIMGIEQISCTFLGVSMCVLGLDELLPPRHSLSMGYRCVRYVSLLTAVACLMLLCVDLTNDINRTIFDRPDIYKLVFGVLMPFVSQFLMIMVKDYRKYTLGTLLEVCEFGFPFTAMLSVVFVGGVYGQSSVRETELGSKMIASTFSNDTVTWFRNYTAYRVIEPNTPYIVFYVVAPFLITPTIILYVSCVLVGKAIDPILSLCASLAIERVFMSLSGVTVLSIYALSLAIFGMAVRIMGECRLVEISGSSGYDENVQLTTEIIRDNVANRGSEEEAPAWT